MHNEILPLVSDTHALDCRVVVEIDLNDERYVLLAPVARLLTVVRDDKDGLEEVPASAIAREALQAFADKLAAHDMAIETSGDEYLLKGDLSDAAAELCDSITVGAEDDDETHLILADFEHEDALYLLLTPELPPLFPAKVQDGKALPLSDDELEGVEAQLAKALESAGSDAH